MRVRLSACGWSGGARMCGCRAGYVQQTVLGCEGVWLGACGCMCMAELVVLGCEGVGLCVRVWG